MAQPDDSRPVVVWKVTNSVFPSNTYLCETGLVGRCVIVDPGTDPDLIEAELEHRGLWPSAVVLTHGHFDHAGSAAHFQERFGLRVFMNPADRKTIRASNFLLMAFKLPFRMTQPETEPLDDFPVLDGCLPLVHVPAPGHTPGSSILRFGEACFTGDTLYANGIGLSSLPGEDHDRLRSTLHGLWDSLDPAWTIYPGHGRPAPFGIVRERNVALRGFLGLPDSCGVHEGPLGEEITGRPWTGASR